MSEGTEMQKPAVAPGSEVGGGRSMETLED